VSSNFFYFKNYLTKVTIIKQVFNARLHNVTNNTRPDTLDYNSPHVSAAHIAPRTLNNCNFRCFIIIRILFYYSTVNFKQKLFGF